ncbi:MULTISPECIES: IS4/Tn5 family transposase DNA-binding protein [Bradyrhizobium]|uniref:IS4/Tn5 family transposase DNA-binding protein n=1 Tax=Bradyrhizobium TaxID=374 RepID=UPI0014497B39|nr:MULTISPECIES: transposase [Bradyrhizobium]MDI2110675.1 transposase [Bradyrhizobium sp. Mp64]WLA49490.1 transposase [Bradyrhizobium elkanii]WLB10740.1 transposase [Bradyrhizobium elkanii]WLB71502.1 transposase [Bradyrhizobium elkanii]WLB80272.1 transposase [Bradyrhizobium elkanii]
MGLVLKEHAKARAQRSTTGIETWVDREAAGCEFKDERLGRRFGKLLAQIGSDMGQSIPLVCQDWANTKAASLPLQRTGQRGGYSLRSFRSDARARNGGGWTDPRPS